MKTTPTTTTVSIETWKIAHHLRISAEGYFQNCRDLTNAGYEADHPVVNQFHQQALECRRIADAINNSVSITVDNLDYGSVINITTENEED
jgi:hypothetical protein